MNKKLNILLVLKSGGDFNVSDVLLLSRNIQKQHSDVHIYCLYDKISSIITIDTVKFLPMPFDWIKWWSKLNLFAPPLKYLRPFLYFDLDTIILDNIEDIIPTALQADSFIALKDWYKPHTFNSSMLWIPFANKKIDLIWNTWVQNSELNMKSYRGDQEFMYSVTTPDILWQEITDKIINFKPNKIWLKEKPTDKSIVCFHGNPRIPVAANTIEWVRNYINNKL